MTKFFILIFISIPQIAFSQDRGLLFNIGNTILGWAGYSYTELEQKISSNENERKQCLKDLKECPAYDAFRVLPPERGIGFSVKDILSAGCQGFMKLTHKRFDRYRGDSTTPFEGDIEVGLGNEGIFIKQLKKSIGQSKFENEKFDIALFDYRIKQQPPSVILGQAYEMTDEAKGGSLDKGVYKYKYFVTVKDDKKLEVTFEGDQAEQLQNGSLGLNYNYKFTCLSKTIEELNSLASQPSEMSKKVFGE